MRNGRVLWVVATWLSFSGCSSDSKHGATDAAAADIQDGGDGGEELTVQCPDGVLDADSLIAGVTAKGTNFIAKFVDSDPAPPARYDNTWTVDFTDLNGAPISDMQMTSAQTWMPYHNHGFPGSGTPMASQPGRFKVKINLNMRGYFEVRMFVKSGSSPMEDVKFLYCFR